MLRVSVVVTVVLGPDLVTVVVRVAVVLSDVDEVSVWVGSADALELALLANWPEALDAAC